MTVDDESLPSVSAVLGLRARGLRAEAGLKVEEVAKAVSLHGLKWTPARVSELEAGKVAATISNLTVLSAAFSDLLERPVRLADWLTGGGAVKLTDEVNVPLDVLREILAGEPVSLPPANAASAAKKILASLEADDLPKGQQKKMWAIYVGYGEAEERAADALGVDKETLCWLMLDLWGETLSTRRDSLADPNANPQKRGRIARQLRQELEEAHRGNR